jgi:hypothetical protein
VGLRNISHAAVSHNSEREQPTHPEIAMNTPAGAQARHKMGEDLVRIQTNRVITDGLALGYRYTPSPIVWDDGTASAPSSASEYRPIASPGSRAPHAWLSDGRSTVDLFGKGFTLMRLGADAPQPWALQRAFTERDVPLSIVSIAEPAVHRLYERALVLVRPDGHVAWRSDEAPADPLALVDCVRGAAASASR